LHEPFGAFVGYRHGIESALHLDDGLDQKRIDPVKGRIMADVPVNIRVLLDKGRGNKALRRWAGAGGGRAGKGASPGPESGWRAMRSGMKPGIREKPGELVRPGRCLSIRPPIL
jgi:hypothetical protein